MHGFANPARFLRIATWATPLCLIAGLLIAAAALVWGVGFGPADVLQGDVVRIIYLHVPTAWLGMMGWSSIAIASFVEIVWRHPLAGIAARATACPARCSRRCACSPARSGGARPGAHGGCGTGG
jgi:heme exporter protein C